MEQNYIPFGERGPSAPRRLFITLGLALLGAIVGGLVTIGIAMLFGFDFQSLTENFGEGSPLAERNTIRLAAFLNHLFTFLIPAIVASYLFYKKDWLSYQRMDAAPITKYLTMGTLMIFVALPFVYMTYWLNSLVPLPEILTTMENATAEMVKGLLIMDSPMELIFNLIVIAIMPAVAEEMIFRGIVQDSLEKMISNPHVAILVASIIFSAIHMQFEGFLPRMVLGMILGYLFYWTRNLWIPIVAHAVNNGSQVIVSYLYPEEIASMEPTALDSSIALPGIISLVLTIGISWYILKMKDEERMVYR